MRVGEEKADMFPIMVKKSLSLLFVSEKKKHE